MITKQKWQNPSEFFRKKNSNAYNYNDIVDFELLKDAELISSGG